MTQVHDNTVVDLDQLEEFDPATSTVVDTINGILDGSIKVEDLNIDEMAKLYVQVRGYKSAQSKVFKQVETNCDDVHERLAQRFREQAEALGLESLPTKYGTAYKLRKTQYRVKDWPAVLDFIQRTDNFQMLEKRIGKNATAEIHQATGEVPPGVEFNEELTFTVRKK